MDWRQTLNREASKQRIYEALCRYDRTTPVDQKRALAQQTEEFVFNKATDARSYTKKLSSRIDAIRKFSEQQQQQQQQTAPPPPAQTIPPPQPVQPQPIQRQIQTNGYLLTKPQTPQQTPPLQQQQLPHSSSHNSPSVGHVIPPQHQSPMMTVTSSPVPTPPHHHTTVPTRHPPTYQPSQQYNTNAMVSPGPTTVPPQTRMAQPQVVSPEIMNGNGGHPQQQQPTVYQQPAPSYPNTAPKHPQAKRPYDAISDGSQPKPIQPAQWTNNIARTPSHPMSGAPSSHHNSPQQGVYPGSSPTMQPENKRLRMQGPEGTPNTASSPSPSYSQSAPSPYHNQSSYNSNFHAPTSSQSPSVSPARTDQVVQAVPPQAPATKMHNCLRLLQSFSPLLDTYVKKWEPVENLLDDNDKRLLGNVKRLLARSQRTDPVSVNTEKYNQIKLILDRVQRILKEKVPPKPPGNEAVPGLVRTRSVFGELDHIPAPALPPPIQLAEAPEVSSAPSIVNRLETHVRNELEPLVSRPDAKKAMNVKAIPKLATEMLGKLGLPLKPHECPPQVDALRQLQMTFNNAMLALSQGPQASSPSDPLDLSFVTETIRQLKLVEVQWNSIKAEVKSLESSKSAPPPGSDSLEWMVRRKPPSAFSKMGKMEDRSGGRGAANTSGGGGARAKMY